MKKNCATCNFWQRDGVDGICRIGNPAPVIVEDGKKYIHVWPRTSPDDFCGSHLKTEE